MMEREEWGSGGGNDDDDDGDGDGNDDEDDNYHHCKSSTATTISCILHTRGLSCANHHIVSLFTVSHQVVLFPKSPGSTFLDQ